MTVYFGKYEHKPGGVEELPAQYRRLVAPDRDELPAYDFWTNNILFVEPFSADEVVICGPDENVRVCDHPQWSRFESVLSVGEFISCVYNKKEV